MYRSWLEQNKIYFETVAATLLSMMAVLVSCSQLQVARVQTKVAEEQLALGKATAMPRIMVTAHQLYDDESKKFTEDELRISNIGTPAFEARSDYAVFLDAKITSWSNPGDSKTVRIPMRGYYGGTGVTQGHEGLLFTIRGDRNHSKMANFEDDIRALADSDGYWLELNLYRLVNVSFKDILGGAHNKYYFVRLVGGSSELDSALGEQLFDEHDKAKAAVTFYSITSKELYKRILEEADNNLP